MTKNANFEINAATSLSLTDNNPEDRFSKSSLKIPKKIKKYLITSDQLYHILNQYIPTPPQKSNLHELDLSQISHLLNANRTSSDDLAKYISNSFPNLETLNFSYSNLTNEGVKSLSSLIKLKDLNLCGCWLINDAGLKSLSSLTSLQSLDIYGFWLINYAGLKNLSELQNLNNLNLSNCTSLKLEHQKYFTSRYELIKDKIFVEEQKAVCISKFDADVMAINMEQNPNTVTYNPNAQKLIFENENNVSMG